MGMLPDLLDSTGGEGGGTGLEDVLGTRGERVSVRNPGNVTYLVEKGSHRLRESKK